MDDGLDVFANAVGEEGDFFFWEVFLDGGEKLGGGEFFLKFSVRTAKMGCKNDFVVVFEQVVYGFE